MVLQKAWRGARCQTCPFLDMGIFFQLLVLKGGRRCPYLSPSKPVALTSVPTIPSQAASASSPTASFAEYWPPDTSQSGTKKGRLQGFSKTNLSPSGGCMWQLLAAVTDVNGYQAIFLIYHMNKGNHLGLLRPFRLMAAHMHMIGPTQCSCTTNILQRQLFRSGGNIGFFEAMSCISINGHTWPVGSFYSQVPHIASHYLPPFP